MKDSKEEGYTRLFEESVRINSVKPSTFLKSFCFYDCKSSNNNL